MRPIDADELLKRVQQEKIQAQVHGREFSTCFLSPGGTPSTEWWYVEDLIENTPTIEPEREKGKWIPIDEDSDVYECDVCRTTYDTICGTFDLPYFCPHCGADMRGDQNG